jgi:hypothetical protein
VLRRAERCAVSSTERGDRAKSRTSDLDMPARALFARYMK